MDGGRKKNITTLLSQDLSTASGNLCPALTAFTPELHSWSLTAIEPHPTYGTMSSSRAKVSDSSCTRPCMWIETMCQVCLKTISNSETSQMEQNFTWAQPGVGCNILSSNG